ncbi:SMP-30/gluconolactonase/LRE family protein [Halalkalibaculum sp. DA3122]|uniref:SMP-30/gluconolactonase/LRE family protein n=1 Tax=Halalkalibaculum sp. DA3122 TaxID=3373607 RepID=UPI003754DC13
MLINHRSKLSTTHRNLCNFTISLLFFVFLSIPLLNAQNMSLAAENAELELLSDRFAFTEGPAADRKGNVFFTDQPNNHIWKYSIDGELTLYMDEAGRSNGMYFDHKGNLLTCADEKSQLWRINPDKTVEVLVDQFRGKRLNGPNDLWVDPKGGVYFTDPYYQRDYWERTEPELDQQRVYYLTPDRQEVVIVADELVKPNGIIGTPEGETLYVADIGDQKTYSYAIESNGHLSDKTEFTDMGSDGMTIDEQGNIYLTGDGVTIFNKAGKQVEHIPVPENWTANVTFGGSDRQTLFMTASTSVYTLKMNVEGR